MLGCAYPSRLKMCALDMISSFMGGFALPILDFLPQALVASSEHVQVKIQKLGHSRRFLIRQPRVGSAALQIRQGVETRVFGGIRTVAVCHHRADCHT